MRISRLFIPEVLQAGHALTLTGQSAHYLGKVLRLAPGASVLLFNGDGLEYPATLVTVDKKSCTLTLDQAVVRDTESRLHTILGLGISRGERMDYAIQKSTELGVSEIVPLFTGHCEVRLNEERQERRQEHWQQIAISACEQCGRVRVPTVHPPRPLADWLREKPADLCLVLDHDQEMTLEGPRPDGRIALLIGPEGGLSPEEIRSALDQGFTGVSLGPRVLRTETAPVAALAILQYLWG